MASREAGALYIDVRANTARLEADLNKARGELLKLTNKSISQKSPFDSWAGGLGTFTASIGIATAAVGGFILATKGILDRGQSLYELSNAFKALGNTDQDLLRLRAVTQGLVSDIDLFKSANMAAELGVTKEAFNQLAASADTLGDAVGVGTVQALESLTKAYGTGQEKALKQLGITIDNTKAEEAFAASIGTTADKLNEKGKLQAFQNEMLIQVIKRTAELGEAEITASDALTQATNATTNLVDSLAGMLNQSPFIIRLFEDYTRGVLVLTEAFTDNQTAIRDYVEAQQLAGDSINKLSNPDVINNQIAIEKKKQDSLYDSYNQKVLGLNPATEFKGTYEDYIHQDEQIQKRIDLLTGKLNVLNPVIKGSKNEFIKTGDASKKAASDLEQFQKSISSQKIEQDSKRIGDSFDRIFKSIGDSTTVNFADKLSANAPEFNKALEELKANVAAKTSAGWAEGFADTAEGKAAIARAVGLAETEVRDKLGSAVSDVAVKMGEDLKKQIQDSAAFFSDAFYNVFTGAAFDFKDILKRFGAGVLGGIAGSLFPGAGAFGNLQGLGQSIGQGILGSLTGSGGGLGSVLSSALGGGAGGSGLLGNLFSGSGGAGLAGSLSSLLGGTSGAYGVTGGLIGPAAPTYGAGLIGPAVGPATGIGAAAAAAPLAAVAAGIYATYSAFKDGLTGPGGLKGATKGVTDQFTSLKGGLQIFATGGLSLVAGAIGGLFGHQKTQGSIDRKAIFGQLEQTPLGKDLSFSGVRGNISLRDNDLTKFKPSENKLQNFATPLVSGLSNSLFGAAGGTVAATGTNIFAQAVAEGKNYTEVLINVRSLMDKMGIGTDQLKEQLKNTFLDAVGGLEEYKASLASLVDIGKGSVASIADGFNVITDSTTTNRAKLAALSGTFVRFGELGIKSTAGLTAYLTRVFGPQAVAVFDQLRAAGIDSAEDIAKATAEQIAGILTQLQGLTGAFEKAGDGQDAPAIGGETAPEPSKSTGGKKKTSGGLSDADIQKQIDAENAVQTKTIKRKMSLALVTKKIDSPSTGGGNSPRTFNINVDARGAQTGVDQQALVIANAIRSISVTQALDEIDDYARRSVG